MGKYMKKSKITGEVAVMEVSLSPQCSLGVRTRAKTLALQRQQQQEKEHQQKSFSSPGLLDDSSFSYLELRSRRLEKPSRLGDAKRLTNRSLLSASAERCCGGGNPSPQIPWSNSRLRVGESEEKVAAVASKGDEAGDFNDVVLEASFGENNLEFDARDRSTRESTPCSLVRGSDTLGTPGSTTRRKSYTATNQRVRNDLQRSIPTAQETDEFFAFAEQQQQRIFIEKYNFDIVNDSPLPGRYEWVQVMP